MDQEIKNSRETPKASFDVVSAINSLATEVRRERESAEDILDFDKQKKNIRERIIAAAKVQGETFSEEDIVKATDMYFDRQYRFIEPKENFVTKFADMYVDRARLGRKYGIPTMIAVLAAGAIFGAVKTAKNIALNLAEKNVETLVLDANAARREISSSTEKEYRIVSSKGLPTSEKVQANALLDDAKKRLASTDDFFVKYCPNGNSTDVITRDNYRVVESQVAGIVSSIEGAKQDVLKVTQIVELQDALFSEKQGLEALMAEVRNNNPPTILAQRAEVAYQSGLANISSRDLNGAKGHEGELRQVISDVRQFAALPSEEAKIYSAIKAVIAKDEKEGIALSEKLHTEAQTYISSVDVPRLNTTVQKMNGLNGILNQDYDVRIVSREGVKSGIDRYYQGSFSGWYLVVEAIDSSSGNVVPVQITNSENGQTSQVTMWGERVHGTDKDIVEKIQGGYSDSSLLVKVIKDKMDNGIVDDNQIGKKKKGYLHYKLNSSDFEGKQITSW